MAVCTGSGAVWWCAGMYESCGGMAAVSVKWQYSLVNVPTRDITGLARPPPYLFGAAGWAAAVVLGEEVK